VSEPSASTAGTDSAGAEAAADLPRRDVAGTIYLGIFVVYVVLLGIGVFAEAFHIQWILDWPIY